MRTKDSRQFTKDKLALDTRLVENLKSLGLIESASELSKLMGKNETYYACMKRRGYGLHLGSLAFLATKLARRIDQSDCVRERAKLRIAISAVNETIQAKCSLREQELHS